MEGSVSMRVSAMLARVPEYSQHRISHPRNARRSRHTVYLESAVVMPGLYSSTVNRSQGVRPIPPALSTWLNITKIWFYASLTESY